MERVKIDFPEKIHFTTSIPVRIGDINYGNHVGNDATVAILQESRVQFLQSLGYSELDVEGVGLILSDLTVVYKKQLFYGDHLTVQLSVEVSSAKSFILYYQLVPQNTQVAVVAKTTMICFDYTTQKIALLPEKFLTAIGGI